MAIFKCKMCGGTLEINTNATVATCEYCGAQQTLPKLDDEHRASLYERGNHFRRTGDFDKALAVYEHIVQEDDRDAEAHWCCALCRFGIEYVEDPTTFEWVPTCHRASFDSILEDVDYLAAVEHSEGITRRQYQKDAAKIAEVQRGILATSQKEEPFDVFICYKESDDSGNRTKDSTLAQDIYYQLTEQGRRVFFARITLEDKVGAEYEPYIFAALNSAKVMVVVGTKPEHFNAVWVKNEWSRFLALMKKDRSKLLLPCYRDMDPYDLPEQLSVLQSYDMGKIGFIQDLTRGIAKVLDAEVKPTVVKETVVSGGSTNTAPLLKRAFIFLEDGDWASADEYCEKVLDIDPENAQAYLGKLMAELRVRTQEALRNQEKPFDNRNNYQKVIRYADEQLKTTVVGYIDYINTRNEYARLDGLYNRAKDLMSSAVTEQGYKFAADLFAEIIDYEDSAALIQVCHEKAEGARKDEILSNAKAQMTGNAIIRYEDAIKRLEPISGWKDADKQIAACKAKIEELTAKEEAERLERELQAVERERQAEIARKEAEKRAKRNKKIAIIAAAAVCVIIAFVVVLVTVIIPNGKYKDAVALMEAGKYDEAITAFKALDGHKDSAAKIDECNTAILDGKYNDAVALMDAGKSKAAAFAFRVLGDYKDAQKLWMTLSADTIAAGGSYTVSLKADGTVVAVGGIYYGQSNVSDWRDIVAIAAGDYHTVGLKADGTVVAVGYKSYGQCKTTNWSDITAIAAGEKHTVGLKADGTVVAVGDNVGQCNVSGWRDIVAIAAGSKHTVGLKADGTVVAVGGIYYGQSNVSDWRDIASIAAGYNHTVGLKSDGTVVAVGDNGFGQCNVSEWRDIVAIAAADHHTVGLKSDGTVVAVGFDGDGQRNVSGWTDIVAIAAGAYNTVGLKSDGTVVVVGSNAHDQCNVSDWRDIRVPGK